MILKTPDIFEYELSKFMYKINNGILPTKYSDLFHLASSKHSHQTRSSTCKNYFVPQLSTSAAQKDTIYQGIKLWNKIPANLKAFSLRLFSITYRSNLIDNYKL